MIQSRTDSLMESLVNIAIGLVVSTIANLVLLQWIMGFPMSLHDNVVISTVFTAISLIRSYCIRRAFNGRSVWSAIKDKFNARQVRNSQDTGLDSFDPRHPPRRSSSFRVSADFPTGDSKWRDCVR